MKNKTTNIIKKSELKELIRGVISEIAYNDPLSRYNEDSKDIINKFMVKQDEMGYTVDLDELKNELVNITLQFVIKFPEMQKNSFESVARVLHSHLDHDPDMMVAIMKTVITKLKEKKHGQL